MFVFGDFGTLVCVCGVVVGSLTHEDGRPRHRLADQRPCPSAPRVCVSWRCALDFIVILDDLAHWCFRRGNWEEMRHAATALVALVTRTTTPS